MPRMNKQMVGLAGRSAKSVLADGCCADFEFVLMSSSSAEGVKRHAGYVCRVVMHGDVQQSEAERTNTRLTEQVAEICGGRWLPADSAWDFLRCCVVACSFSHHTSQSYGTSACLLDLRFYSRHCDIFGVVCSCVSPRRS